MKAEDLVIGKRYRIRQWEDMESEFGTYFNGDLNNGFSKGMRPLCGKTATLNIVIGKFVRLFCWTNCDGLDTEWNFNADMLEEIEVEPFTDSDEPAYYNYKPKYVIRDWGLNFNLGNVIKYTARAGKKDDIIQDLEKAKQYLKFEIKALKKERKKNNGNNKKM